MPAVAADQRQQDSIEGETDDADREDDPRSEHSGTAPVHRSPLAPGFSQVISNTAAAVLMAPIVLSAAAGLGVSPHPMMMGLAVAASSAFLTPIGTAPNLMVMAPGGYRFTDYMKVGAPLLVAFFAISLILIPIFWPF